MVCPSCNAPNRDDAKFCKKCGQSFRVEAPKVSEAPVGADVSRPSAIYRPQENANAAEDPAFAPAQIISPQQMIEFHQRRWQQQEEQEEPAGRDQAGSNRVPARGTPTMDGEQPSEHDQSGSNTSFVSAPEAQAELEAQDIADMPTVLITPSNTGEPIPPPPPPPPDSASEATPIPPQSQEHDTPGSYGSIPNPYTDTAAQAEVEQA